MLQLWHNPRCSKSRAALKFLEDAKAEFEVFHYLMNLVWAPVHFAWLAAGVALRRMDLPKATQRLINLGMAGSLIMVVVLAAWSELSR